MTEAILSVQSVTKRFGALVASDDVSLDLKPDEIYALIGPNGAGKSTLIQQIAGGLTPDEGNIRFAGENVTAWPVHRRAKAGLARTFQISALAMEDSVLQNVLLGMVGAHGSVWRFFKSVLGDKALREKAENALDKVGLLHKANIQVSALSHGERRLLEIAIALTLSPKAFIMDEPMAGLGGDGSEKMTVFLDQLKQEAPILLVEHDMDAVFKLADRISVLVYGKIIATGCVDEIREDAEVRKAYLGDGW